MTELELDYKKVKSVVETLRKSGDEFVNLLADELEKMIETTTGYVDLINLDSEDMVSFAFYTTDTVDINADDWREYRQDTWNMDWDFAEYGVDSSEKVAEKANQKIEMHKKENKNGKNERF